MYPLAVQKGIPSDEYWNMTLEEILVQVDANQFNQEQSAMEKALFDYKMAQMLVYAFNEPKEMPSFENAYPFVNQKEEVPEEEKALLEIKRDQEILLANIAQIKATQMRKQAQNNE